MIICEWKSFSTDTETYNLEDFKEMIGDEFEAMMFKDDNTIPAVIWTVNFVILVKKASTVSTDILFEKVLRNPICE